MKRRDWKRFQPSSLQGALEASVDFARERYNLSIDQIAERMGLASKWTLYKWLGSAAIPLHMVRAFEHATGTSFVTQYMAISGRHLLIPFPTGRTPSPLDIHDVQAVCTAAVGALIGFADGKTSAEETTTALTNALQRLAAERSNVERHTHPELELR